MEEFCKGIVIGFGLILLTVAMIGLHAFVKYGT